MVVVAIVSILAVIALPAYVDYVNRSKVSEGLAFVSEAKTTVAEYYHSFRKKQKAYSSRIERLNARLDEEDESTGELKDSFRDFKREIAKAAVFTRSGKSIPMRVSSTHVLKCSRCFIIRYRSKYIIWNNKKTHMIKRSKFYD